MTKRHADFKIRLDGMMMNNHYMAGSEKFGIGFVDSGTTFTYINTALYNIIKKHFEWFCSVDAENHCKGRMDFSRRGYLCFSYDVKEFQCGPLQYFKSFPILRFLVKSETAQTFNLNWYPSEYLYREKADRYCVAVDISEGAYLTLGGTLMR